MTTDIIGKVVRLVLPASKGPSHSDFLDNVKQNLKTSDRVLVIISGADQSSMDIGTASHGLTPADQIALLEVAKLNIYTKLMAKEKE